ncbi:vesicle-associated membrane [Plasmopara halstedii]|uniref:Vesicle-associated membrane n=1 Tax=Plasmopara halstedii TaxID=4781 RepID=A0A0P1AMA1_PLAHL|nr:vesicle-associated membrane [Plasmopara halstedii]CEG42286.1 vesicle-associated membrane [Plasmopara halstedii]|eukprot:XP_024578655.1 vesicle-associated membrane [Plasmopara halstedii]
MSIYYCVVANSHCPLVEHSNGGDKRMNEFAQKLLKKINLTDDAVEAMEFDGKTYSYRVDNEVAYVCVTNAAFGKSSAALFLKHINQLFDNQFGIRGKATKLKLDMNRDFAPTLKNQMEMFSSDKGVEKLQALRKDLDNVTNNMQNNINKVLERGDKIELLVDKTDQLNSQSAAFAKSSKNLRRHLWWENLKMNVAIGAIIALFLILIVLYIRAKFFGSSNKEIDRN